MKERLSAARKVDRIWRKIYWPYEKFTEVDGRSPGCTKIWRKLTKDLPTTRKFYENWQKVFWPHEQLTKSLPAARKVDGSRQKVCQSHKNLVKGLLTVRIVDRNWRKVYRQHRKFLEVNGRSPGGTESWRKLTHGLHATRKIWPILMEGLVAARNVDRRIVAAQIFCGSWLKFFQPCGNFTEGPLAAQKVDEFDRRSKDARKVDGSWWKVFRSHGKLMKVHRRSPRCKEIWQKLTKGRPLIGKLIEVDGRCHRSTESWWCLMESLSMAWKVDWSWWKASRLLEKLMEGLPFAQKVNGSWWNVYWPYRELPDDTRKYPGCTES